MRSIKKCKGHANVNLEANKIVTRGTSGERGEVGARQVCAVNTEREWRGPNDEQGTKTSRLASHAFSISGKCAQEICLPGAITRATKRSSSLLLRQISRAAAAAPNYKSRARRSDCEPIASQRDPNLTDCEQTPASD